MKTTPKTTNSGGLFWTVLFIFSSFLIKAEETEFALSHRKSEMNSLYIIGGVLVMGIVSYIIYSSIDKNRKEETPAPGKRVSHKHHHHHRVVKKSS